jgi:hypothetical protein
VAQGYDAALGAFGCQLSRLCGTFSALGTVALERKVSLHPRPSLLALRPSPLAPRPSPLAPRPSPLPHLPLPTLPSLSLEQHIFFFSAYACVCTCMWVGCTSTCVGPRALPHSVRRVQEVDRGEDLMDPGPEDLCVEVTPIHKSIHTYEDPREGGKKRGGTRGRAPGAPHPSSSLLPQQAIDRQLRK